MEKDEQMTVASDDDFLASLSKDECMALYGDEDREGINGTQLNERRRFA